MLKLFFYVAYGQWQYKLRKNVAKFQSRDFREKAGPQKEDLLSKTTEILRNSINSIRQLEFWKY